jgi:lysophospholipase L1-like esterase
VDFVGALEAGGSVPGTDPDHEGHVGATAYDVAFGSPDASGGVYAWLEANPADVVLLHVGTHGLNTSPADVGAILDEIDRWEASEGGHPVSVLLARIIDQVPAHPDVALFNDSIAALAVARKTDPKNLAYPDDVTVVNLNGALNYPQDIEDGIHPDQAGYAKMADVWFVALTQGQTAVLDKCP